MFCSFSFRLAGAKIANTQYPEGKPLMRGDIKFSKLSDKLSFVADTLSISNYNTIDKLKFVRHYSNNREINSARRRTPNFMKMCRR